MKISPGIAAGLVRGVLFMLGATCRFRFVGEEPLVAGGPQQTPVVLVNWHEQALLLAIWLTRRVVPHEVPLAILSSASKDGEIAARVAAAWGVPSERGSSSRGGLRALRRLHRTMEREGVSVVILPDGPRGPRREAKAGAVVLAQLAGASIVPLVFRCGQARRLGSWDRMLVPRPFATIEVEAAPPMTVPAGDPLEPARQHLEEVLNQLQSPS